jgi:hypothetical protein
MLLSLLLVLTVTPRVNVEGLDKPKKAQTGKLEKSQLAAGNVTIRCMDVGRFMLVEINDPGLKGAKDVWLKKKNGDAMPPCDANETDVIKVEGAGEYGYVDGVRGEFIFVSSADAFGDRMGLRVFSATSGAMLLDVERSTQKAATLKVEGASLWLQFIEGIPATCDPVGDQAAACWKELRESAKIPDAVEIKPPPCDAEFKGKKIFPGSSQIAVPVEVDLNGPKYPKRFRAGEATCSIAP